MVPKMTKQNWIVFWIGVGLLALGYFLVSLVGEDYHGFKAFISVLTIVVALITVGYSFVIKFPDKGQED